ncbi:hypothetical protein U0070_005043 [Myodes glareolus]|uniref:Uncharacterized protein n=1 Tax=Myodes glareolus TaxID=447135 RepID=A0AAW0IF52_MYOGA
MEGISGSSDVSCYLLKNMGFLREQYGLAGYGKTSEPEMGVTMSLTDRSFNTTFLGPAAGGSAVAVRRYRNNSIMKEESIG